MVGTRERPFDINTLSEQRYRVGPFDRVSPSDEPPFHIYLLGHDAVGDMHIQFGPRHEVDRFGLSWKGRIARFYAGERDFRYGFRVEINSCAFEGFEIEEYQTDQEAWAQFRPLVTNPEAYVLKDGIFLLEVM
ncbi:hypothetical protein [Acanthopleuribacter pedis]|uniref:Uncharacterized protein n=1 Tax=Acanthopleuribacter pedis TaxID=442870 RepID=A0A8J7QIK4_9BACT|nr:hypothetical protein [Acanthopleuribacter pedis]MBO1320990.1 hypothetical protein [Acanthopleuribacter pedis]MBO1323487.1 hypothetical protein [Acanthopleuribacter pedis]